MTDEVLDSAILEHADHAEQADTTAVRPCCLER
jgi:hypothetical protein